MKIKVDTITKMQSIVDDVVEMYQSDFEHDLNDLKDYTGAFWWSARSTGTHLVKLPMKNHDGFMWVKNNIEEKYMFGSKKPVDIITKQSDQFQCEGWRLNTKNCYFYDGKKLRHINPANLLISYTRELKSFMTQAKLYNPFHQEVI